MSSRTTATTLLPEKEKLTSPPNSNYDAWAIQIQDIAKVSKVWKIILGTEGRKIIAIPVRPANVAEEAHLIVHQAIIKEQEKIDKEWEEHSDIALALLRMNLSSTERTRVMKHADPNADLTAHDLWTFLRTAHYHATTGQVFSYTFKFVTFKTSAYVTIHETYEAITSINAELRRHKR